jgi:hypothetical protein
MACQSNQLGGIVSGPRETLDAGKVRFHRDDHQKAAVRRSLPVNFITFIVKTRCQHAAGYRDRCIFRFACDFARQASSGVLPLRDNGVVAKLTSAFALWLAATGQSAAGRSAVALNGRSPARWVEGFDVEPVTVHVARESPQSPKSFRPLPTQSQPFISGDGMAAFSPKTAIPRALRQMPYNHSDPAGSNFRSEL